MAYIFALLVILAVAAFIFIRVSPARIAEGVRVAGPAALGIGGVIFILMGRAGIGGMLISGALALYLSRKRLAGAQPSRGQRSHVRTAALEMELDHDSGRLEGVVLVGRFEGRELGAMSDADLLVLHSELSSDPESLQLLETYFDGRMPGWRDDAKADERDGLGTAPASGAMTKQEAYEILGLEPGASAAETRKAHRRLMQRVHPDLGGTSSLAARINEAKDVLLARHD